MRLRRLTLLLACVAGVLLASSVVLRADPGDMGAAKGALDTVVETFRTTLAGYETLFRRIATRLFTYLLLISIVWSFLTHVIRGTGFGDFFTDLVRQLVIVGLFYALLTRSGEWLPAIVNYFTSSTATATLGLTISPSNLISQGLDVQAILFSRITVFDMVLSGVFVVAAVFILLLYVFLAAMLILAMIEMYFINSFGILMLGFGGADFTRQYAKALLTYSISVGVKLGMLHLILATGTQIMRTLWIPGVNDDAWYGVGAPYAFAYLAIMFLVAILANKVPAAAQNMINGVGLAGSFNMGGAAFTAGRIGSSVAQSPAVRSAAAAGSSQAVRAAGVLMGPKGLVAAGVATLAQRAGQAVSSLATGTGTLVRGATARMGAAVSSMRASRATRAAGTSGSSRRSNPSAAARPALPPQPTSKR